MTFVKSLAPLIIIGGAEDKKNERKILREFVRLAGPKPNIVVMTVATELPEEVGREYLKVFGELIGAHSKDQIQALRIESREEANNEAALTCIKNASAVFFTGGEQYRITSLLGGTKIDALLHERHEQGLILAGTSAGASMMSSTMIIEGSAESKPRFGMVRLGAGLEFLPGVIIDQHFAERGRIHRLLSAVAQFPHHLGIGIDEDTALIVEGHEFKVLGNGAVTIVDAGGLTNNNILELKEGDYLALCNVKLHILPSGYRFDLRGRSPVNIEQKIEKNENKVTQKKAIRKKKK